MVAVKPEISMEDAKEVHTSLRKAAGLIKFVQVCTEVFRNQLFFKGFFSAFCTNLRRKFITYNMFL